MHLCNTFLYTNENNYNYQTTVCITPYNCDYGMSHKDLISLSLFFVNYIL